MLAQLFITHDPATDAVAQQDDMPADRLAENQVVKSRHAVQLRRRHSNLGHVRNALIRYPAAMPLNDLQRLDACRAIVRDSAASAPLFPSSPVHSALFRSASKSAVHVGHDKIDTAQNGDQIGNHQPAADQRHHLQMRKGGRANPHAVRHRIAVANQVIAIVPLGRFDAHKCFAGRNDWPPAHTQKMGDERFDVMQRLFLERRRGERMVRFMGPPACSPGTAR